MAGEDIERRLAAIMSADVAGYSRLMGTDEAGTLSALKALRRDVFAPQVAAHKGRVVKLMGDGALVEFPSIVNAVDCAISVQRALAAHWAPMSVVGYKQTSSRPKSTSALPPRADIPRPMLDFRF